MRNAGILLLALFLPLAAHAEVVITEIMYDLPGADTTPSPVVGREWIEVRNDGADAIDLSLFKLFEAEINHKITSVQGEALLAPNSHAIVADNATNFLIDNPGFSGVLFDSAFSLSNTGETLVLKNGEVEEDNVTYTSQWGGAGDGTSLQLVSGSWKSGVPTPGAPNVSSPPPEAETESEEKQTNTAEDTTPKTTTTPAPAREETDDLGIPITLTVKAGKDRTVIVGGAEYFEAQAYRKTGAQEKKAKYKWNFGNGFMRHGQKILFQYNYPGTYVALVTVEGGSGSKAFTRFTVTAEPALLSVPEVTEQGITVKNSGKRELDLSMWSLRSGTSSFVLPEHTILLPGAPVLFPHEATGLSNFSQDVALVYPNGKDAAVYGASVSPLVRQSGALPLNPMLAASTLEVQREESPIAPAPESELAPPFPVEESLAAASALMQEGEVGETTRRDSVPAFLGLLTVLTLGLILMFIIRNAGKSSVTADDFTIVDDTPVAHRDGNNTTPWIAPTFDKKELPPRR